MGFLGFGKKDRVVDLGERYRKSEEATGAQYSDGEKPVPFADMFFAQEEGRENTSELQGTLDERKKKLVKKLVDITKKLDEISTQIYHLQQRVELLERKTGVRAGT